MIVSADPRITAPFAVIAAPAPVDLPDLVWIPCSRCWGQRVVWYETDLGLVPCGCGDCRGLGEQLVPA